MDQLNVKYKLRRKLEKLKKRDVTIHEKFWLSGIARPFLFMHIYKWDMTMCQFVTKAKDSKRLDCLLLPKISKRHFLEIFQIPSCGWLNFVYNLTKYCFEKILKTDAASPILVFFYLWLEIQIECIKRLQTWWKVVFT